MGLANIIRKAYRGLRVLYYGWARRYSWVITCFKFHLNAVDFKKDFVSYGVPIVDINMKGKFKVGHGLRFNSGKYHAMGGRQQQCYFVAGPGAEIIIGNNVGLTSAAIISRKRIVIEDNVKIGINTVIYDTDFHSLYAEMRNSVPERIDGVRCADVHIKEGAFIGGHSTILKGVTIGKNSIVGAGSVVFESIPDEQIWVGNPAKFVRNTYGKLYPAEQQTA